MDVELLYVPDCPNGPLALRRLRAALVAFGRSELDVREREVATAEDAGRLGMRGSPTVLVDGRDPFADAAAEPSLSCRLYRTTERVEGAPSVDQLVEALSA